MMEADSNNLECAICEKKFKNRYSIQQHITRTHGEKKFECNCCGFKFRLKHQLTQHLPVHETSSTKYECAICEKEFKNRCLIQRHITRSHGKKKFKCNRCDCKFRLKHQLTHHLPLHEISTAKYECAICKKEFKNRCLIQRHITRSHSEKKFECYRCNYKFRSKRRLAQHLPLHDTKCRENEHCYKCGFCFSCFRSKREIIRHFENNHKITMKYKQLHFNSKEDFKKFKLDYQRKSTTQFIVRNMWKHLQGTSILYKCHRSGLHKAKEGIKKFPKIMNPKKIQSYCPAEMVVKLFEDGKCIVNFQESHVGHNIDDPSELCYINVDPSEKEEIAIQYGVPKNKIRNEQILMFRKEKKGNQLDRLCNQDIYNVAASFGIQSEYMYPFNDDMLNINAFVEMHGTSVLYYKKQLEEDTKFYALADNDFALVFMNEFQERNLRRYGKNLIAFDSIPDTNLCGFVLHSLFIMNINYEGVPVAFFLSNRNDEIIINIFLQCIKDRVGILSPQVILTDMLPIYKNSWMEIMRNVPDFILWCIWHVREAWRKNFCKITDKKKREEVKEMVLDLACEVSPVLFHCKLDAFLSTDDVELEPFIAYFRRYYVENEKSQMWAYCYRKDALINTNMSLESFYRSLKYNHDQKKNDVLSGTLHFIVQYLDMKKITEESGIRVMTNQMKVLRKRHHLARKKYEIDVISKVHVINSNSWLVESFEKANVIYVVEKKIVKECVQYDVDCGLYCDLCKFCLHEYSCDCLDAIIRNNMCQHIHAVGILENRAKTHTKDKLTLHKLEQVGEIVQRQENPIQNAIVEEKKQDVLNAIINEFSHELEEVGEIVQRQENPIQNTMVEKKKQDVLNTIEKEFSHELEEVGETVQLPENHIENMKVKKKRQEILSEITEVLKKTSNLEVLSEIKKRFVKPILNSNLIICNKKNMY